MAFIEWTKCFSEPKQMLRLVALILCVCLASYQLSQCFHKIVRPPIYTHNSFEFNTSMRYPSITICRNPPYKTQLFPKYGLAGSFVTSNTLRMFDFENYSLDAFFNEATYTEKDILLLKALIGRPDNIVAEEFLSYRHGRCFRLTPVAEMYPWQGAGYSLIFSHTETVRRYDAAGLSLTGFIVNIHDRKESFTMDSNRINSFMDRIYIEPAEEVKINLKPQEFTQLPNANNGYCNEIGNYSRSRCLEDCFYKKLTEKVGCSVPWMENKKLPRCNKFEDTIELTEFIFSESPHPLEEECDCPNPCFITMYSAFVNGRKDNIRPTTNSLSVVTIHISNNLVMAMFEVPGYDWNMLLADLGGSLGFLLGLSVLGLIGAAEHVFKVITTKKNRPEIREASDGIEENNMKKPTFMLDQQIATDNFDICKNNFIKETNKLSNYPSIFENRSLKSMDKF